MTEYIETDLTVLNCHHCSGTGFQKVITRKCPACAGTGSIFWVDGYSFPYTPEGEKRAKKASVMMEQG